MIEKVVRLKECTEKAGVGGSTRSLGHHLFNSVIGELATGKDDETTARKLRVIIRGVVTVAPWFLLSANHPFGLLDGAALSALLSQVRSNVKFSTLVGG